MEILLIRWHSWPVVRPLGQTAGTLSSCKVVSKILKTLIIIWEQLISCGICRWYLSQWTASCGSSERSSIYRRPFVKRFASNCNILKMLIILWEQLISCGICRWYLSQWTASCGSGERSSIYRRPFVKRFASNCNILKTLIILWEQLISCGICRWYLSQWTASCGSGERSSIYWPLPAVPAGGLWWMSQTRRLVTTKWWSKTIPGWDGGLNVNIFLWDVDGIKCRPTTQDPGLWARPNASKSFAKQMVSGSTGFSVWMLKWSHHQQWTK